MTKTPIPTENSKTNGQQKNFDYTTITDRLRTVSWSHNSHSTDMVKPVYGYPTFPLTTKVVYSKGGIFKKFVNNPPNIE